MIDKILAKLIKKKKEVRQTIIRIKRNNTRDPVNI